ncbi:MAG: MOSC domain-containing protein [Aggregatilineales bacterium]
MFATAQILSITYKPMNATTETDGFLRVAVESANLITDYGIEGDRKGGHPKRQINLMGKSTLDALTAKGYKTEPGAMGEQMIVSGIEVDDLPVGTVIQLGHSARVEVTQHRAGCPKFETTQNCSTQEAVGQMGVMVRVLSDGQVHLSDPVKIMNTIDEIMELA